MLYLPEKYLEKTIFPPVVDNTMLETWSECQTQYGVEFILCKSPSETSVDLHAGASFAKGLEVFRRNYYGESAAFDYAYNQGAYALWDAYGDFIPEQDSPKSKLAMMTAYDYFLTVAFPPGTEHSPPYVTGGKPAIEFSFALPIPEVLHPLTGEPILYCGRLDQIVQHGGTLLVEDDKTTKQLGATWRSNWTLRSQFTGYVWGVLEFGYPVTGALVRGVSILKYDHNHEEVIIYRNAKQIARWYEEVVARLKAMKEAYVTGRLHQSLGASCSRYSGCPYVEICQADDPFMWLDNFKTRVWNPLERDPINQRVKFSTPATKEINGS